MTSHTDDVLNLYRFFSIHRIPNLSFAIEMGLLGRDSSERLERFEEIIEKETHYLIEETSYRWNEKEKRFERLGKDEYQDKRNVVAEGLLMFMADYSDLRKLQKSH